MKPIKLSPAAALVIATALVGAANAQAPSPSGGDHESHHPPAASEAPTGAPTQPSAQSQTGSGGMMGPGMMSQGMMGQSCMGGTTGQNSSTSMMCMRDMMSMMGNMMNMMGAQSGMMASNIEGRITALKTELKITDTQTPAWNRFAEALRATAGSMNAMYEQMMQSGAAATLPARLERRETMLSAHLNRVKTLKEVLDPLYASFSDEQKKIADGVMIGPMGMM
jgi:hypothetical protein